MTRYEEVNQLLEERCGGGKDNVITLSTISLEQGVGGMPCPAVREVDAMYENGVFYVMTYALSNKMKQIARNPEVAFALHFEEFSGNAIGENLGWVMNPENAELREKLRKVFADWYDAANNEKDTNCVILAIRITKVFVFKDHGAVRYTVDYKNRTEIK